jgi:hypothetical protein
MAANSTQISILVRRENYLKVLGVSLTIRIDIDICLDWSDKRYLRDQCWKVEIYIPKVRKKICAVN